MLIADDEVKITIIDMLCLQLAPKAEPLLCKCRPEFCAEKVLFL